MFAELQDLALTLPCGFCGAKPDRWCLTEPNRQLARHLHEARLWAVRQAYAIGWAEGYDDAKSLAQAAS